jgi:hypothetical protein
MAGIERSPHYGELQEIVNKLYRDVKTASALDALVLAETYDLPADLIEVIELMPPGTYTRVRFCGQLNSIINGHAWGMVYGTVE